MGTQTKCWKKYSSCEQLDMVATFASQTNTPKIVYRKSKNRRNDVFLQRCFAVSNFFNIILQILQQYIRCTVEIMVYTSHSSKFVLSGTG